MQLMVAVALDMVGASQGCVGGCHEWGDGGLATQTHLVQLNQYILHDPHQNGIDKGLLAFGDLQMESCFVRWCQGTGM